MNHQREKIHPLAEVGPLDPNDYKVFYELFTDKQIIPFLPEPAIPKDHADAQREIQDLIDKEKNGTGKYWGIYHCNRLIGTVGLHSVDTRHHTGEISYEISPDFWGKGISTHAVIFCIEYTKVFLKDIKTIKAYTLLDNIPSQRVAEKSGFTRIGICKNDCLYHGKIIDRLLFEIELTDD